ncbi:uncharacterized protein [Miscanthus floridulus]|uniref:uncharacterized protein n=1 Tax=Miscanthus floridulus TaxID=154761 RepID=UPI003459E840
MVAWGRAVRRGAVAVVAVVAWGYVVAVVASGAVAVLVSGTVRSKGAGSGSGLDLAARKKRGGFDVFTAQGFDNWKKVNDGKKCGFLVHVGSTPCSQHNNAVRECQAILNQPNHIENILEEATDREKERNRLRLRTSIAAVKWLTFQSCAFRGRDETPQSKNRGNFIEMLKLLGEFNPEIASVILENAPKYCKYTSPDIQKEILSIFVMKVRKHIREEIGDAKFSILVDETCDVAKREQMALVFRFVDINGVLQERFFDLIHVKNTKALTLKEELCTVLSKYGFDIQNLRGQGYDGASNMKGELNGLQALFLRECPYAYYVHCYAHRLQLALVAAAKDVVPVTQFFQHLLFIVNTVDSSSKRHDELHDAQMVELARLLAVDELETGQGENQIRSLRRPGDTRWGSHLGSISSLMNMFKAVSSVLQNLGADSTAGANRADGDTSFRYLTSFEFVFVLCMMREMLEITEQLGQALQKKSQDIVNAIRLVQTTKVLLEKMRSDDGWETFFGQVVEFCMNHDILIPNMEETYILRGGRARRQPEHFTKERYYRVEIFRATIDTQLAELNLKFNEKVMDLLSISVTLVPRNGFAYFQTKGICRMVEKYYPLDFNQQEMIGLERQLNHFTIDASTNEDMKNISTLVDLCRGFVKTGRHRIFNLVDRLIRLLVTLPVSTATAERIFSVLKIVKTRLRNKIEDQYLANSLLVQVEGEIVEHYTYDDIISDFKDLKNRRADF